MSMKADLLNPELGYFDEGECLTESDMYESATLPFGNATMLPPVAYRSKIFAELENEKLWTRSWIPIGFVQQIPNPGDLLPFTIGFHGVHVQRNRDGSISARFNRHQHGGCRFVPDQCRTGKQTKCTIASCNYTRDADVMPGAEDGGDTDPMYKFVGVNPDKLVPVSCEIWCNIIFINVDPNCEPLAAGMEPLPTHLRQHIESFAYIRQKKWQDVKANWKNTGYAFAHSFTASAIDTSAKIMNDENVTLHSYVAENITLPTGVSDLLGNQGKAWFSWFFPNLLIIAAETHVVCIIMQPTAMGECLERVFLLDNGDILERESSELYALWSSFLQNVSEEAEKIQDMVERWGTASLPGTSSENLSKIACPATYVLQQHIVNRILTQHRYYRTAPIMDAGFRG